LGPLARSLPAQQTYDGPIFVEIRPVDAGGVPKDLKMAALLRCAVPKPGIPNQRDYDRPTINKVNRQGFVGYPDRLGAGFLYFNDQRTHANRSCPTG